MADASAVIADLVTGAYDDQLVELGEALDTRKGSGEVDVAWSVTFDGVTIDKTNKRGNGITIGAVMALARLNDRSRDTVDPKVSDQDRLAIVMAYFMAKDGISLDDAAKVIGEQKFDDISVSEYVEKDLPKDG